MLGYVTLNVRFGCGGDAGPQAFGATSIRRLNLSCMACSLFRPGLQWWRSTDVSRYRGHRECVADAPKWPESAALPFPPCRPRDLIRSTTIDRVKVMLRAPFYGRRWMPVSIANATKLDIIARVARSRQRRENPRQGSRRSVRSSPASAVAMRPPVRAMALLNPTRWQCGDRRRTRAPRW